MNNAKLRKILLLFMCAAFLMAMTNMGNTREPSNVSSAFDARIIDVSNNEVDITSVNIDGKASFTGYLGKGKVNIPFENISYIEISKTLANVILKDSKDTCKLTVNGFSRVYGNTTFGRYQIALKDIKRIEIIKAKQ